MIELDPCASRTVKPRKPAKQSERPIIAVDPAGFVLTEHGARVTFDEYIQRVIQLAPHFVVSYSPETWLWKLHSHWQDYPHWSWRVAVTCPHGRPLQVKRVTYYGYRDPKKKHNRYHVIVDAGSFYRKQDREADDLLALGQIIRAFCNAYGLELRASAAGIAGQLLRHPDFYPFARRRVPEFINEAVRPHLPGGLYESYAGPGQRMEAALYIDQESAHHYAAETTPLPDSNSVRAIGYSRGESDKRYARKGRPLFKREIRNHGLIKAQITVPHLTQEATRFAPPLAREPGTKIAHVWTNELPYLESLGVEVDHLIAVWGTTEVDRGIAAYARWAREVQRQYPAFKTLLLMPYGLLARRRSTVTYHHPGGDKPLILANQYLDDTTASDVVMQPETANALQLGLIQAFVRTLSLDMARQVTAGGSEVVSIYADGVFVKATPGQPIPLFTPWRLKEECTLELTESLRVPVRRQLKRDYLAMTTKEKHNE